MTGFHLALKDGVGTTSTTVYPIGNNKKGVIQMVDWCTSRNIYILSIQKLSK